MKDRIGAMVCTLILVIGLALIIWYTSPMSDNTNKANAYALTAQVIEIDYANDIVTVEDFNGNTWQFSGTEDWELLDCVSLVMNDHGTDTIVDDIIVDIKYDGWMLIK